MKEFFTEYGGMLIAMAGALAIIAIFYKTLLSGDGQFLSLLMGWCSHAC